MPEYSLTELQLEIMNILWERGEATVTEVREAVQPTRALAHTTIATLLTRLEKKGVVTHRTKGRQYVYLPVVEAHEMRRSLLSELSDVADRLFDGSIADVVTHLLSDRDVNPHDLARVREMIEANEAKLRGRKKK